jgi:hypothetical protein
MSLRNKLHKGLAKMGKEADKAMTQGLVSEVTTP